MLWRDHENPIGMPQTPLLGNENVTSNVHQGPCVHTNLCMNAVVGFCISACLFPTTMPLSPETKQRHVANQSTTMLVDSKGEREPE